MLGSDRAERLPDRSASLELPSHLFYDVQVTERVTSGDRPEEAPFFEVSEVVVADVGIHAPQVTRRIVLRPQRVEIGQTRLAAQVTLAQHAANVRRYLRRIASGDDHRGPRRQVGRERAP